MIDLATRLCLLMMLSIAPRPSQSRLHWHQLRPRCQQPPSQFVRLLQSRSIRHVRIYDTDATILTALANSGIDVGVTIPNADVAALATSAAAAAQWVEKKVLPYSSHSDLASVAVGNEFIVDSSLNHSKLLPDMKNVRQALESRGLGSVQVSTLFSTGGVLAAPRFPPSSGTFSSDVAELLGSMLPFLSQHYSVFMISVYPFFAYRGNPTDTALDYRALLNPGIRRRLQTQLPEPVRRHGGHGDLRHDGGIPIVIMESGWASGPDPEEFAATEPNAQSYYGNLVKHVLGSEGTPLRPGSGRIPTFVFALFNENLNWGNPVEQHFGLYYPN